MTNLYRHQDWVQFRSEVIALHGGHCAICHGSAREDGLVLQVHHKHYVSGRKPWEYEYSECEALCKGCHAQEHGIIMPQRGWSLIAFDDLGDLAGNCELCGAALRYIYAIEHPNWSGLAVGTDCCDKLTATNEASKCHTNYINYINRRKRFIESRNWKQNSTGLYTIVRAGVTAFVLPDRNKFRIGFDEFEGKIHHETLVEAKTRIFDLIESGEAAAYIAKRKKKISEPAQSSESAFGNAPQ